MEDKMAQQDTPENGTLEQQDFIQAGEARIIDPAAEAAEQEAAQNGEAGQDTPDNQDSGDQGRRYAGRYDSVEDLEGGYKNLQSEYTKAQMRLRELEDSKADAPNTETPSQNQNDGVASEVQALNARLDAMDIERGWAALESDYGNGIREKVRQKFESLPEADQQQLNTMAGARLLAKIIQSEGESRGGSKAMQAAGAPQSHQNRGKSRLTQAEINAMPKDEYARRQAEIIQFYTEKAKR